MFTNTFYNPIQDFYSIQESLNKVFLERVKMQKNEIILIAIHINYQLLANLSSIQLKLVPKEMGLKAQE